LALIHLRDQRRKRAGAVREQQRLAPESATPAQEDRDGAPRLRDRHHGHVTPTGYGPHALAAAEREPTPHDRKALNQVLGVLAVLAASIAVSIPTHKNYYVLGYIVAIGYAVIGPRRRNRPWSELGVKRGFLNDLRLAWFLVAIEAVLIQLAPPNLGLASVFGYYPRLVHHILGRVPALGSQKGVSWLAGILLTMLVLTLLEELVFRVTIQERLSWYIGTPAAILVASALFASAHLASAAIAPVLLLDSAGVLIDGIFLGLIYARTHNLLLTWATHYIADVLGLMMLLFVF
jgi:uncharacterized protein